jgi:hypothetical protein
MNTTFCYQEVFKAHSRDNCCEQSWRLLKCDDFSSEKIIICVLYKSLNCIDYIELAVLFIEKGTIFL